MTDAVNTVKVKVNTATLDNSDQLELDLEDGYVTIGSYDTKDENGEITTNDVELAQKDIIEDLKNKHTDDITNLQNQILALDSNVVHKYNEFANDVPYFDESIYGGKNFYGTTTFNNYITITNAGHLTVDSNAHFSKIPTTITPSDDSNDNSIPNTEWVNKLVSNGDASTETNLKDYISGEISKLRLDDVVHKSGQETIDGSKEFLTIPKTITPSDDSDIKSIPNIEWVNNKIKNTQNNFQLNPYSSKCQQLKKTQICTWFDPNDNDTNYESPMEKYKTDETTWTAADNGYIKFRFDANDSTNNNKIYFTDVTGEKLPGDNRAILFAINEAGGAGFDSIRPFYRTSIRWKKIYIFLSCTRYAF